MPFLRFLAWRQRPSNAFYVFTLRSIDANPIACGDEPGDLYDQARFQVGRPFHRSRLVVAPDAGHRRLGLLYAHHDRFGKLYANRLTIEQEQFELQVINI